MRRLELSTSELLEMRKQGMSNKEIAKCLDISPQTVHNRIGGQGKRNGKATGVSKLPPAEKEAEVMIVTQNVMINGYGFEISHVGGFVSIAPPGNTEWVMSLDTKNIDDLIAALKAVKKICRTES